MLKKTTQQGIKIDIQKNLLCWIKELVKACFAEVSAPRVVGRCSHLLSDVLMIGLYSYISGGTYYQGKKQRGVSPTTRSNCSLYLLNVRVSENRFCPYQKEVQDKSNAAYYQSLAREHWGIDNQQHWVLDVVFKKDTCRAYRNQSQGQTQY